MDKESDVEHIIKGRPNKKACTDCKLNNIESDRLLKKWLSEL